MGITAHYIIDFTMHSAMLACKRFTGSHTGENIFHMYQETMACYDIAKISTIVTDNAANMKAAFDLFDLEDTSEEEDEDPRVPVTITDELDNLPPQRNPCFAHTLQLCIKDAFISATQINTVIAKAAPLIKYCRKSTIASDILEPYLKLQMANDT